MRVSNLLRGLACASLGVFLACGGQAFADDPTPSHLAAAKQLVVASGTSKFFAVFVPQIDQQILQMVGRTRPELSDDLEAVMKSLDPEFQARQSEIIDQAAQIFAASMSEQELKDTVAFFSTPAGKKYADQEPLVRNQLVGALNAWSKQLSQVMMTRIREEMKKKGRDF